MFIDMQYVYKSKWRLKGVGVGEVLSDPTKNYLKLT